MKVKWWKVPKVCFMEFEEKTHGCYDYFYVDNVVCHNSEYYLVKVNGSYAYGESEMQRVIAKYDKDVQDQLKKLTEIHGME